MRPFNLTRWPLIAVFCLAGAMAAIFAFVTYNLFSHAMANLAFLREFGLDAIRHGALLQVAQLLLWGALSLSCWLIFKACEHVLVQRYLSWAHNNKRRNSDSTGQPNTQRPAPKA